MEALCSAYRITFFISFSLVAGCYPMLQYTTVDPTIVASTVLSEEMTETISPVAAELVVHQRDYPPHLYSFGKIRGSLDDFVNGMKAWERIDNFEGKKLG